MVKVAGERCDCFCPCRPPTGRTFSLPEPICLVPHHTADQVVLPAHHPLQYDAHVVESSPAAVRARLAVVPTFDHIFSNQ
ncbi:unnamed protein product [Allacma fusca]|uniref:Uncharacterized protein n=1 Tax=Allacma fusca TaxID=39272 RepID=A0A8J2PD15_9HEXA|nr:unnamed protein product [Allacma fusca]